MIRSWRLIELEGPEEWVKMTLEKSIKGTMRLASDRRITAIEINHLSAEAFEALITARGEDKCPKRLRRQDFGGE